MKRKIVEASGYSVRSDAENQEVLDEQAFFNELWQDDSLARQEAVNEHNSAIDQRAKIDGWNSRSWLDRALHPHERP